MRSPTAEAVQVYEDQFDGYVEVEDEGPKEEEDDKLVCIDRETSGENVIFLCVNTLALILAFSGKRGRNK